MSVSCSSHRISILVVVTCLVVAHGSPLIAGDSFSPQAILSFQTFDNGLAANSGFHQTYDLRLEKALSDPVSYRLYIRAEDFTGTTNSESASYATGSRRLQPGAELSYLLPTIRWNTRFDLFDDTASIESRDSKRRLTRVATDFGWAPDRLPAFYANGERRISSDDASGLERQDDNANVTVSYLWRSLQAAVGERYNETNDGGEGFSRRYIDHNALAAYDRAFFHGRLTTTASGIATRSQVDERAKAGGTTRIPNPVVIPRALYAVDDTPLEMRDHPLVAILGLNDGDLRTASQVYLGPDGVSYQNVAFDFGRVADVDEIRIIIRDENGDPVRTGGAVRWDVFTSEDGISWIPSPSGARSSFYAPLSYYQVEFTLMHTRWLKVVNFGVNIDPAWATETQAFYHTTLAAGASRRTDIALYSAIGTVAAAPAKWINLTYAGLFNSSTQQPDDGVETSTTDANHSAGIQFDPRRWLSVGGRYDLRTSDQRGGFNQEFDGVTGLLTVRPTQEINVTFEAQRQSELIQDRIIRTDANIVHTYARLLPALDVSLNAGTRVQDFATEDTIAKSQGFDFITNAQLFRGFRVTASASRQRTKFEGGGLVIVGLPPERDDRWYVEGEWRPGPPLSLGVRYGGVSTDKLSSTAQRYRIQWFPFAGGAVSLSGTYEEDIDPYTNRRSTRAIFAPSWLINRYAIFDLNYTMMKTTGDIASDTSSFNATLTLRR